MTERVEIKKGQIWCSFDNEFIVEDYREVNNESWVYYCNQKNNTKYSCLEEAFRSRFYPVVNRG